MRRTKMNRKISDVYTVEKQNEEERADWRRARNKAIWLFLFLLLMAVLSEMY